jgi:hypothetical protein
LSKKETEHEDVDPPPQKKREHETRPVFWEKALIPVSVAALPALTLTILTIRSHSMLPGYVQHVMGSNTGDFHDTSISDYTRRSHVETL